MNHTVGSTMTIIECTCGVRFTDRTAELARQRLHEHVIAVAPAANTDHREDDRG